MGIASSVRYWPSSAAIVESSNDAIISTNLDGTIATWNKAAGAIFGYRPQEVIGRSVFLLAAPGREDEMPVILDQIKRGQRIQHYETVRRHKNGHQVPISLTVSPIRADNGRIVGADRRDGQGDGNLVAVLVTPYRLVMLDPLTPLYLIEDHRHLILPARCGQQENGPPDDLLRPVPKDRSGGFVPGCDGPVQVRADDSIVR